MGWTQIGFQKLKIGRCYTTTSEQFWLKSKQKSKAQKWSVFGPKTEIG